MAFHSFPGHSAEPISSYHCQRLTSTHLPWLSAGTHPHTTLPAAGRPVAPYHFYILPATTTPNAPWAWHAFSLSSKVGGEENARQHLGMPGSQKVAWLMASRHGCMLSSTLEEGGREPRTAFSPPVPTRTNLPQHGAYRRRTVILPTKPTTPTNMYRAFSISLQFRGILRIADALGAVALSTALAVVCWRSKHVA